MREEIAVQFVETCGYELVKKSELLPDLDIQMLAECVKNPNPLAAAKAWRQGWRSQL